MHYLTTFLFTTVCEASCDKGMSFVGNVIKELCELTGMERSTITPYHPMGNGITERLNHTLLNLMGTLNPNKKKDWKSHIGPFNMPTMEHVMIPLE